MKRIPNPKNVYQDWPIFFWERCSKCKYEFRREYIWRVEIGPFVGDNNTEKYYCLECCPTAKDAYNEAYYIPPPPSVKIIKQ